MNKLIKTALEKTLKNIAVNPESITFSLLTSKLSCPCLKIKPQAFSQLLADVLHGQFLTFKEVTIHDLRIQIVWKGIKPAGLKIQIQKIDIRTDWCPDDEWTRFHNKKTNGSVQKSDFDKQEHLEMLFEEVIDTEGTHEEYKLYTGSKDVFTPHEDLSIPDQHDSSNIKIKNQTSIGRTITQALFSDLDCEIADLEFQIDMQADGVYQLDFKQVQYLSKVNSDTLKANSSKKWLSEVQETAGQTKPNESLLKTLKFESLVIKDVSNVLGSIVLGNVLILMKGKAKDIQISELHAKLQSHNIVALARLYIPFRFMSLLDTSQVGFFVHQADSQEDNLDKPNVWLEISNTIFEVYEQSPSSLFEDHHFIYKVQKLGINNLELQNAKDIEISLDSLEVFQAIKSPEIGTAAKEVKVLTLGNDVKREKTKIQIQMIQENEYLEGQSIKTLKTKVDMSDIFVKVFRGLNILQVLQKSLITCSDLFFGAKLPSSILKTKQKSKNNHNSSKTNQNDKKTSSMISGLKTTLKHRINIDPVPNPAEPETKESSFGISKSSKFIIIQRMKIRLVDKLRMPLLSQQVIQIDSLELENDFTTQTIMDAFGQLQQLKSSKISLKMPLTTMQSKSSLCHLVLTNLCLKMLNSKHIQLSISLISLPHINSLFLEELRTLLHDLMTISKFSGLFLFNRVDYDTKSLAQLDHHDELIWRRLIAWEKDNTVPSPDQKLIQNISLRRDNEKVQEQGYILKNMNNRYLNSEQLSDSSKNRINLFPQMNTMNEYTNVLQALYKQEDSQDLADFVTKQKINRFKFLSDDLSFDVKIDQFSMGFFEKASISQERIYLFQLVIDNLVLKSGEVLRMNLRLLKRFNECQVLNLVLKYTVYFEEDQKIQQTDVEYVGDKESCKPLLHLSLQGTFHPENLNLQIDTFTVDTHFEDLLYLEKLLSPYCHQESSQETSTDDKTNNSLNLQQTLQLTGQIGKIRSFLSRDYEIMPDKYLKATGVILDGQSFEKRGYSNLKVAKLSKNDFMTLNYPWITCYHSKQHYEVLLEEDVVLQIEIEIKDTLPENSTSSKPSQNNSINLILMPRSLFLNLSGTDVILKTTLKPKSERRLRILENDDQDFQKLVDRELQAPFTLSDLNQSFQTIEELTIESEDHLVVPALNQGFPESKLLNLSECIPKHLDNIPKIKSSVMRLVSCLKPTANLVNTYGAVFQNLSLKTESQNKSLIEIKTIELKSNAGNKVIIKLLKNDFQSFTLIELGQRNTRIFILYSRVFLTLGNDNFKSSHLTYPICVNQRSFQFDYLTLEQASLFEILRNSSSKKYQAEHTAPGFIENSSGHKEKIQLLRKIQDYNTTLQIVRYYKELTIKNCLDVPVYIGFQEKTVKTHTGSIISLSSQDNLKMGFNLAKELTDLGKALVDCYQTNNRYLVVNLEGRLIVVKFNLGQRNAEIHSLVRLSGFSQMSGYFSLYYTWNSNFARKNTAVEWVSGEELQLDIQLNDIESLQKYFTLDEINSKNSFVKVKNAEKLKALLADILVLLDIIYPSSFQDQELTPFLKYPVSSNTLEVKKTKSSVLKRCGLSKVSNSCVLSNERILSFKIEFIRDCTCIIQAYSPSLKDLGYFLTVPSKKYLWRISPSLFFELSSKKQLESVSDNVLVHQIARKIVRDKTLSLQMPEMRIKVRNDSDTLIDLNLSGLAIWLSQTYNLLNLRMSLTSIQVSSFQHQFLMFVDQSCQGRQRIACSVTRQGQYVLEPLYFGSRLLLLHPCDYYKFQKRGVEFKLVKACAVHIDQNSVTSRFETTISQVQRRTRFGLRKLCDYEQKSANNDSYSTSHVQQRSIIHKGESQKARHFKKPSQYLDQFTPCQLSQNPQRSTKEHNRGVLDKPTPQNCPPKKATQPFI